MSRRHPPSAVGFSPPKFKPDDPELLTYLEAYGYAVVSGVANAEQVARAHDDFWAFHEGIGTNDGATQVLRSDSDTWGSDFLPHPATGIITGYGFGQSRFCWNLRTLPGVNTTFAKIWETEDLVSSFDGGAAFRPWSAGDTEWRTQGGWWHCDQNATRPNRSGRVCVQGLVQLTPANEYTGGFCVIPGSHKGHEAFSRRHPSAHLQGDFLIVPDGDPLLSQASGFHLLRADPGDLILWDSRTIHCNGPAIHPPESAPSSAHVPKADELLRLVGYVCCTPASWCTTQVQQKRAQAAIEKTTSTHWPHAFVPTGYRPPWEKPRTPNDYSDLEARLILGMNKQWPVQYLPKPSKALSQRPMIKEILTAKSAAAKKEQQQASGGTSSSAPVAGAAKTLSTRPGAARPTPKVASKAAQVASSGASTSSRPPLSSNNKSTAANQPLLSSNRTTSNRSSGAATSSSVAPTGGSSRKINPPVMKSGSGVSRPEMKKVGSKGILGRLVNGFSPRASAPVVADPVAK